MRNLFIILSVSIVSFVFLTSVSKAPTPFVPLDMVNGCQVSHDVFKPGEKLEYTLYYNLNFIWLKAGTVVFKVTEDGDNYKITADGKTFSTYEWFFKVRDHYEVFVDKKSMKPVYATQEIREGGYRKYLKMNFDWTTGKVESFKGNTPTDSLSRKVFPINECEQDVLSLIYFARNLDYPSFHKGNIIPVDLFLDEESWSLKIRYDGVKDIKVKKQGRFKVHKLSPETIAGTVFEEGTEMNIYATDDDNRLPLLIESPVSVGSVKAILTDYSNLKYDIKSKLD